MQLSHYCVCHCAADGFESTESFSKHLVLGQARVTSTNLRLSEATLDALDAALPDEEVGFPRPFGIYNSETFELIDSSSAEEGEGACAMRINVVTIGSIEGYMGVFVPQTIDS